jgi:hypothetical protein
MSELNPKLTRAEYDEVMRWRLARMREAGETIPSFSELVTAMKAAIKKVKERQCSIL